MKVGFIVLITIVSLFLVIFFTSLGSFINHFKPWCTSVDTGDIPVYITLTSTYKRVGQIGKVIESLNKLEIPVLLNLPIDTIPEVPKYLYEYEHVQVLRPEKDIGPATKLLASTLDVVQNPEAIIVVVDDDVVYSRYILTTLIRHSLADGESVQAMYTPRKIGERVPEVHYGVALRRKLVDVSWRNFPAQECCRGDDYYFASKWKQAGVEIKNIAGKSHFANYYVYLDMSRKRQGFQQEAKGIASKNEDNYEKCRSAFKKTSVTLKV
jgi:hypothetical protein